MCIFMVYVVVYQRCVELKASSPWVVDFPHALQPQCHVKLDRSIVVGMLGLEENTVQNVIKMAECSI